MSRPGSVASSAATASTSTTASAMSHDCLFCCAFNAFLLQHKCYHKLLGGGSSSTRSSSIEMAPLAQHRRSTSSPAASSSFQSTKPWFIQNVDVSRDEIAAMLADRPVGSFLVRPSKSCGTGAYVLSVRVPGYVNGAGIAHYLIQRNAATGGFKFQNGTASKEWRDIESLVIHHTIMREFLPCTLQMPQTQNDENCYSTSSSPINHHGYLKNYSSSASHSRSGSLARASNNDHEVLSDLLQSLSRNSRASLHSSTQFSSRPTVCY